MTYFTALMMVMRKSRNVFATASAPRLRLEVQSQGVAFAAERRTAALPRVGAPPALSADGDRNVAAPCRPPAASGPEFNHARLLPSLDLILITPDETAALQGRGTGR